jgi:hypothetical protein
VWNWGALVDGNSGSKFIALGKCREFLTLKTVVCDSEHMPESFKKSDLLERDPDSPLVSS